MKEHENLLRAVAEYLIAEDAGKEAAKERIAEMLGSRNAPAAVRTAPADSTMELERKIRTHLVQLGAPSHIKGYNRLIYAIRLVEEDPVNYEQVTKCLYPKIAKEFDDTPARVERAIRHCVDLVFERADPETLMQYFGNTISAARGKATNSEFICRLADIVRNGL